MSDLDIYINSFATDVYDLVMSLYKFCRSLEPEYMYTFTEFCTDICNRIMKGGN